MRGLHAHVRKGLASIVGATQAYGTFIRLHALKCSTCKLIDRPAHARHGIPFSLSQYRRIGGLFIVEPLPSRATEVTRDSPSMYVACQSSGQRSSSQYAHNLKLHADRHSRWRGR